MCLFLCVYVCGVSVSVRACAWCVCVCFCACMCVVVHVLWEKTEECGGEFASCVRHVLSHEYEGVSGCVWMCMCVCTRGCACMHVDANGVAFLNRFSNYARNMLRQRNSVCVYTKSLHFPKLSILISVRFVTLEDCRYTGVCGCVGGGGGVCVSGWV